MSELKSDDELAAEMGIVPDIPKNKSYPADAVQCNGCGGWGCATCEHKGWLSAGHPNGRLCRRPGCDNPIPPSQMAIYCTNECAFADA